MSRLASKIGAAPELLLNGRYQVVEVLSSVGWGKTYVAVETQRPDKPKCVIKQIQAVSNDPDCLQAAKRLFDREAKILETLGYHDQVPRLLDSTQIDLAFYLVQEFIAGQPLSAELSGDRPWSESQVAHLLWEVLDILAFVHSKGIIHGNLQPDKLIRRASDDKLVLIGFNPINQVRSQLVAVQEQLSATVELGKLGYMPMEQIRGNPRPSSDIYALGMIGIQALTGLNPMQLEEDPRTGEVVWQKHATVSEELAAILTQMVRYHFNDRYQSTTNVLTELQPLVSSDSSAQLAVSPPEADSPCEAETIPDTAIDSAALQAVETIAPSSSTSPKRISRRTAGIATSIALGFGAGGYFLTQSASSLNLFDRGSNTLVQAQKKYQAGNLQEAVALAKSISSDSPAYQDAQAAMQQWPKDWQNAQAQFEAVKKAFAQQQWLNVLEEAARMPNVAFWQQKIQPIVQQAQANLETEAYELLQQAYNRASDKDFVGALNILEQIPQQTKAYAKVQPKIAEYTQKRRIKADYLLLQAYKRASDQDFTGALAFLNQIPKDTPAYAKAQLKITEYRKKQSLRANYLLQRAYNRASVKDFPRALEYLKQIPENTPAYDIAQEKIVAYKEEQGLKSPTNKATPPVHRPEPAQPFNLQPFTSSRLGNESSFEAHSLSSVPPSPSNLDPGSRLQEVNPQPLVSPRAYPAAGEAGSESGE